VVVVGWAAAEGDSLDLSMCAATSQAEDIAQMPCSGLLRSLLSVIHTVADLGQNGTPPHE